MISVITGTLNRVEFLPDLLENTVLADDRIELILVDGGSTDGTLEFLDKYRGYSQDTESDVFSRIKVIKVGERSSYPHYMNLAIEAASNEIVCQFNDDTLLVSSWDDVIKEIDEEHDFYLFNWKRGCREDLESTDWYYGNRRENGWFLHNTIPAVSQPGDGDVAFNTVAKYEIVLNYGLYKKDVFRKVGMYDTAYRYYCADGDMAHRAYSFGFKPKNCWDIKVLSIEDGNDKRAIYYEEDVDIYRNRMRQHRMGLIPNTVPFLDAGLEA